jgi:hypothetical protein
MEVQPWANLYMGQKNELLFGTSLGTHCELGEHFETIKNLEGTPWEHIRKQGKLKKKSSIPPRPPTNLKEIKVRHLGPSYWLKGK